MESQMNIMDRLGEKQVGRDITVLTEGFDRYAECWFGRSRADAPEIDCKVFVVPGEGSPAPKPGDMVRVRITDMLDWDLMGELCE